MEFFASINIQFNKPLQVPLQVYVKLILFKLKMVNWSCCKPDGFSFDTIFCWYLSDIYDSGDADKSFVRVDFTVSLRNKNAVRKNKKYEAILKMHPENYKAMIVQRQSSVLSKLFVSTTTLAIKCMDNPGKTPRSTRMQKGLHELFTDCHGTQASKMF